jgi:hypothetical protein
MQGHWLRETNINNLWGSILVHLSRFSTFNIFSNNICLFCYFVIFFFLYPKLYFGFDVFFNLIIFWVCCFYSYVFFCLLNVFLTSYTSHIIYPHVIGYLIPCFVVLGFWCFVCFWGLRQEMEAKHVKTLNVVVLSTIL